MIQKITIIVLVLVSLVANTKAHSFIPAYSPLKPISNHQTEGNADKINSLFGVGGGGGVNKISAKINNVPSFHLVQNVPRGGSLTVDKEEENDNVVITKIRNIIRSLLEIGEKKSPIATKVVKVLVKCIQKITGVKLLPMKKKKSKKKNKESKKEKKVETETKKKGKKSSNKTEAITTSITKKQKNDSGAAKAHLSKDIKTSNPNYRIQRELKEFIKSPPPNLSVKVGKNIRVWIITMIGTKGSLYEGEKYRLKVTFAPDYPTVPPSVYFLQPTPRHEHVYTNGDICLSLLGKDWRPTMTAQSIANSILSILSGASRKSLPMDNVAHAQNKPGGNQDNWVYHDDNC